MRGVAAAAAAHTQIAVLRVDVNDPTAHRPSLNLPRLPDLLLPNCRIGIRLHPLSRHGRLELSILHDRLPKRDHIVLRGVYPTRRTSTTLRRAPKTRGIVAGDDFVGGVGQGVGRVLHAERAENVVGDHVVEAAAGNVFERVAEDLVAAVGVDGCGSGQVLGWFLEESFQRIFARTGNVGAKVVGMRCLGWEAKNGGGFGELFG